MTNGEYRPSRPGDEDGLKSLWKTVFGDEDEYIDAFFELLYKPGMARLCLSDGNIVSAAYLLRLGELVSGAERQVLSCVYAFGTHPDYRDRGIGGRVLKSLIDGADHEFPIAVVPAEPGLFDYYKNFGFAPYFDAVEETIADSGAALSGMVTRDTLRGYAALREELLSGIPHIDYDLPVLSFQERVCQMYGGGLFYVVSDRLRCAAAAEVHDGVAHIRELILPSGSRQEIATLVCRALRVSSCVYRAPAGPSDTPRPFAMLSAPAPDLTGASPWLGFAFD